MDLGDPNGERCTALLANVIDEIEENHGDFLTDEMLACLLNT